MIILALMLAAAEPAPEALALGREVAEAGTLAGLLPLLGAKEVNDLIAEYPELSPEEQAKLRAVADRLMAENRERILTATGNSYARQLSIEELRAIAEFTRTPSARRWRQATPAAIIDTMQAVGTVDFKGDVRAAFCKDTGKLCPDK